MKTFLVLSALLLASQVSAMSGLPGLEVCYVLHGVVRVSLPAPGFRMPSGTFVPDAAIKGFTHDGTFRSCADDIYVPIRYKPRKS